MVCKVHYCATDTLSGLHFFSLLSDAERNSAILYQPGVHIVENKCQTWRKRFV